MKIKCPHCGKYFESGLFNWMNHLDTCDNSIPQPKLPYEQPPHFVGPENYKELMDIFKDAEEKKK